MLWLILSLFTALAVSSHDAWVKKFFYKDAFFGGRIDAQWSGNYYSKGLNML
jgi:hypothetical protein